MPPVALAGAAVADGEAVGVGDGDAYRGVRAVRGGSGEGPAQAGVERAEAVAFAFAWACGEAEQGAERDDQVGWTRGPLRGRWGLRRRRWGRAASAGLVMARAVVAVSYTPLPLPTISA